MLTKNHKKRFALRGSRTCDLMVSVSKMYRSCLDNLPPAVQHYSNEKVMTDSFQLPDWRDSSKNILLRNFEPTRVKTTFRSIKSKKGSTAIATKCPKFETSSLQNLPTRCDATRCDAAYFTKTTKNPFFFILGKKSFQTVETNINESDLNFFVAWTYKTKNIFNCGGSIAH